MDHILSTESLLPWLDPESSKIYLKVSAPGVDSPVSITPPDFPFLDAFSPLARLIPAAFTAGSPQSLKDVFLLVQKDKYSFSETQVPFSNRDIDALWQLAGEAAAEDVGCPFSTTQHATGGSATPLWRSLFYCLHRQRYFHPPCPRCGQLLELCSTDEVLLAAGLPAYSVSLQRFLFCPSCQIATGQAEFFAFAAPDTAAPSVKNQRILIDEFAHLIENNVAVTAFPCRGCPQCAECYAADRLAATRIIPLAFYPFRMVATHARQLHAGDFLSLISGASTEELAARLESAGLPGRAVCVKALGGRQEGRIALFFQDGRRFLEALYLKLGLLAQVSRASFAALSHLQHADLRLTIDQFWVDFADYEGPLPYFWNFRAMPLAVGLTPPEGSAFLKVPESLGIHSLALLWFNVLLVNSRVAARDIAQMLAAFYERHQAEVQPDFLVSADHSPVLNPGNIFWQPVQQQLPTAWLGLWQQALVLGWSLLRQSCQPASDFSAATFTLRLSSLAEEVKQSLFAVEAVEVTAMAAEDSDAAISRILLGIRQRWMAELPTEAAVQEVAAETADHGDEQVAELPEEEDLEKTVMMSADQLAALMQKEVQSGSAPPTTSHVSPTDKTAEKKEHPGAEEQADLEKTVMMSADQLAALMQQHTQSGSAPQADATVDEVPPTIRPGGAQAAAPAGGTPGKTRTAEQADLEKTVVMSADAVAALLAGRNAKAAAPAPRENKTAPAKQQLPDAAEAGLSETVMINPKQLEALRKMKKNDK
ncbi:MAG: hypothetical protein KKA54_08350 [Proteobacteria bacterium]|nr:hypothetical protein [Pseudomonadota bacterium]MBU0966377.1 hypothetical protein [Pseudomonadota bacterium]